MTKKAKRSSFGVSHSWLNWACPGLLVASCHANEGKEIAPKALDGWKSVKFGTAFEEAITAFPSVEWNPLSLSKCYQNMALKGCNLYPDRENSLMPLDDGVLYLPTLDFDRFGKLAAVSMEYRKDEGITSKQCQDILERTIDKIVSEHGSMRWPKPAKSDQPNIRIENTAKNNPFPIWRSNDGSFVVGMMRAHWAGYQENDARPIGEWNNLPHVHLLASLIIVGSNPNCSIRMTFASGRAKNGE